MNVTSKTIETNQVELTITVTAEEFAKGLDVAFEKARKKVTVQGFRKGKIPRAIFEKNFGVNVLYDDALSTVLPDVYSKAVKTEGIEPIDSPDWTVKEISKETGVIATATVWTKPIVKLGQYMGLTVTPPSEEVTEADIQSELDKLAVKRSEMVIKEDAAELGDTVVIDYEGFRDGIAFEGSKAENHSLELGSHSFISGFEEQVIGMAAGDEKTFDVTFPNDYRASDLAGVTVQFEVKVHEVKTRQLPEIDDEFVKDLDQDEIETVEQLRAELAEKLTEAKKKAAKNHIEYAVIEQAVANATFEVPEVMIENEISKMVRRLEQHYQQQGISMEMFLQFSGQTMEGLREQTKPEAIKEVEQSLVLSAIVEKENLEVTDEEIENEFEKLARVYDMGVEQVKGIITDLATLRSELKFKKTIKMVIDSAVLAESVEMI